MYLVTSRLNITTHCILICLTPLPVKLFLVVTSFEIFYLCGRMLLVIINLGGVLLSTIMYYSTVLEDSIQSSIYSTIRT